MPRCTKYGFRPIRFRTHPNKSARLANTRRFAPSRTAHPPRALSILITPTPHDPNTGLMYTIPYRLSILPSDEDVRRRVAGICRTNAADPSSSFVLIHLLDSVVRLLTFLVSSLPFPVRGIALRSKYGQQTRNGRADA